MDSARWNEIIATAAATAIDECGNAATVQDVATRAAMLAAEWIAEALAEEQRLADDDASARYHKLVETMRRYMPPDSGMSESDFIAEVIGVLDRPLAEEAANP